jgi:hypothetical protein
MTLNQPSRSAWARASTLGRRVLLKTRCEFFKRVIPPGGLFTLALRDGFLTRSRLLPRLSLGTFAEGLPVFRPLPVIPRGWVVPGPHTLPDSGGGPIPFWPSATASIHRGCRFTRPNAGFRRGLLI